MLGKLIKYDLKFILKSVSIYIVILLLCAIFFNITSYDKSCELVNDMPVCNEPPIFLAIFHTVFWNAIFAVIIGLFLNAAIRTWARFKINFFNDESYLTHTLPVSNTTLWFAKFLSAVIVTIIVIAAIAASFGILQLTSDGQLLTANFGIGKPQIPSSFYLIYLLTVFTQLLYSIMCGFTGITIGNKTGSRSGLRAVICGFAVYLLGIFIMFGCFLIWGMFNSDIHAMIFGVEPSVAASEVFDQDFMFMALTGVGVIYTALITALYFINQKLLSRGVDID